jgi:hypothetical protein
MGVQYTFLATGADDQLVTDWFSALDQETTVDTNPERAVYYFRGQAKAPLPAADLIDQESTPLVFHYYSQTRRGSLLTASEVLFTPSPFKSQFPALHRTSQSFAKWLRGFDLVFSQPPGIESNWNYYLEGSIRNYAPQVYALPAAMELLRSGQYFVHRLDTPGRLDSLAKALQLRGFAVEP